MHLAADRRKDPAFHLKVAHDIRGPSRGGVDAPAERVRDSADLLGDEHLLQHRHPGAPEFLRHVHGGEAELDRGVVMSPPHVVGDRARVLFGVLLPRDQVSVDESARTRLDLSILIGHRVRGHRDQPMNSRRSRWTAT